MDTRVKNAAESAERFVEGAENFIEKALPETPREGSVARKIEAATSRLPSDVWLWASVGSMVLSLGLQLSGNRKTKQASNFIGQWAPTLLILGLYNKLVKVAGHDRSH